MLRHITAILSALLLVLSCQRGPEPMTEWVPKFASTEAIWEEESVRFSASVENAPQMLVECGFIYTVNGGKQLKITSILDRNSFQSQLDEFLYEAEYHVVAYIGNGKHMKYSAPFTVVTPERPYDPSDTELPPDTDVPPSPKPDDSGVSSEPVQPVYELDIPLYAILVPVEGGDKEVVVSGNVGFEVVVPEEVNWLNVVVNAQSRKCTLRVDMNATETPRQCQVQFISTDPMFESTKTLHVTQECCPVHDVHLTYTGDAVPLCNFADMVGSGTRLRKVPYAPDWIEPESISDYCGIVPDGVWIPEIPEYAGAVSRDTYFVVSGSKGTILAHVIQHSPIDNIDFACPVMKQEAVKLWDINGDSEVSFYEAQQAVMPYGFDALNGKPVASFDEYRFFRPAVYLNFAGSAIKSIKFPQQVVYLLTPGIFKDCDKLDGLKDYVFCELYDSSFEGCSSLTEVRLGRGTVGAYAFKGCSSLKTVTFVDYLSSKISIGEDAFSACTSLETLTLHASLVEVGARAFYGCTSLRSLYFESMTPPTIEPDAIEGTHPDLVLYVPSSSVNLYKAIWPSELAGRVVGY